MANDGTGVSLPGSALPAKAGGWTFLTNHSHVLLTIARDRDITLREAAARVGITERAAQSIVTDLVSAGYLTRTRHGRRNSYAIPAHRPLRHPINAGHELDELLAILTPDAPPAPRQRNDNSSL